MLIRCVCVALCAAMLPFAAHADAPRWQHRPGVSAAGGFGIVTLDLDGDGRDESVFSASASNQSGSLGVLARNASGGLALEQVLDIDGALVSQIVAGKGGAGGNVIAMIQQPDTYGYFMVEFGGRPLRELRRLPSPQFFQPRAIADVDADGDLDILGNVSDYYYYSGNAMLRDYATGNVLWTDVEQSGAPIVAQLDADPALEIIIASQPGRVLDGATRLQEWSYPAGFNGALYAGEFDDGGATREFATLLTQYSNQPMTIFRASPYSPLRETTVDSYGGGIGVVDDINGDGRDELILASSYNAAGTLALTPATGTTRVFEHETFRPSIVASSDLMGSSAAELVLGDAGNYSPGPDALQVLDTQSAAIRLAVPRAFGPYAALAVGDMDGDGTDEVLHALAQPDGQYGQLRPFCVLDAASGTRERCMSVPGYSYDTATIAPVLGRFDTAPGLDVLSLRGQLVQMFDGVTLAEQWARSDFSGYGGIVAATAMRYNADAIDDAVVLDGAGKIHVLDGHDGTTLWSSVTLGSSPEMTLTLANVDADAAIEILVTNGVAVYAFDAQTRLLDWSHKSSEQIGRFLVWGTGANCRFAFYAPDGLFETFRCSDRASAGPDRQFPANANLLRVLDATGQQFLVGSAGRVLTVGPNDAVREWAKGLGARLGNNNSGAVLPLGPRRYDVIVGSDSQVYRIAIALDLLFADGFD